MPEAGRLCLMASSPDSSLPTTLPDPEDENLYLPSSLPPSLRTSVSLFTLAEKEWHLCIGQADDALHEIR